MSKVEPIAKYDANGKLIYFRHREGTEEWQEYDSNGNMIHYRNSNGFEVWHEFDSNGYEIHYKNSYGNEYWFWEGEVTEDPIQILLLQKQLRDKSSAIS